MNYQAILPGSPLRTCYCRSCDETRRMFAVWVVWALDKLLTIAAMPGPAWHRCGWCGAAFVYRCPCT